MQTSTPQTRSRNLVKTIPGLLVSAFFLWYTFRGIHPSEFRSLSFVHPVWIAGVLGFTLVGYTLRCVRWARMLQSANARFGTCARVLMTSLAANNIMPLRIGDIMRIFTYAPDLGVAPSAIFSTVILEKLLDVFVVGLIFVQTAGRDLPTNIRRGADAALLISTVGLLVLMFGAGQLEAPMRKIFASLPQNKLIAKMEHWLLLAISTLRQMGIRGNIVLLLYSAVIWFCEGMIFVSAIHLVGIQTDLLGPWEAVSFANLSYMLPSSPGAIGPFEWAVKLALASHGTSRAIAAVFGLAIHAWMLISVTGAGGLIFLVHRFRSHNHIPLLEEIETLPTELP
ncbi:lysylphosphatidylglycerol synthase transmembrane domain-containing protein [Edaphobacter sp. 12200R-103]|uniref:lysylphosphatidylglycerol synthase transmembrane domain-containing protein n=1 Tax=Edaphobacter sp. 12200R-103 TaxID=2703788 RepID=UPI00138C97AA|nr:lysylphosphatidylglycerol synthase transmembrane domain-containing protein [Edaphobacter sp. 12200R-103]QHS51191.1 flippase-like domain-containing protein [Edaphobacter sp. 12200R-103]